MGLSGRLLSKQWDTIPKSYRYKGEYDIRKMAEIGDASSLYRGFSFGEEESTFYFIEAGADTYYQYDSKHKCILGKSGVLYAEN